MRNKLFSISLSESEWLISSKSFDWGSLTNRFSGRQAFIHNYFNLFNGDFSVLQNKNGRWVAEAIIDYSYSVNDEYLIPVLRNIAGDSSLDEGIRQRSTEILEMPWATSNVLFTGGKNYPFIHSDKSSIDESSLSGETRTPQASEILRLLRAKSVESKRQAICMIGKFKLLDMLQEVWVTLSIPHPGTDSEAVLRYFGPAAAGELQRLYLRSSGNISTSKAILRILSKTENEENITFLFDRLWSNNRELKETALKCLVDCRFKVPEEARDRFDNLLSEVTGNLLWIVSAKSCTRKPDNEFIVDALNNEIIYWKRFLYSLLFIANDTDDAESIIGTSSHANTRSGGRFRILADTLFTETKKPVFGLFPPASSGEKKLTKLYQLFPAEIPDCKHLIEDLLNRDYNRISLWTKAAALKNLKEISDDDLRETITALMFSPEEILQEQAAILVARSDRERYRSVSERIPSSAKIRLDRIINGETDEKELFFEKTKFLSSLFPEIAEDKLLFLAGAMQYMKNLPAELPGECIVWSCIAEVMKPVRVNIIYKDSKMLNGTRQSSEDTFLYVLELKDVEWFYQLFPENCFEVFKYIDDNEA